MKRTYSAIITTSAGNEGVQRAIQSVRDQTRPPEETIVVVNGYGGNYTDKIRREFPCILVYEQPDYGIAVARNTGIALAGGEYLCFLDGGDMWHREKLAVINRYLGKNPECRALNHPIWRFSELGNDPLGVDNYSCTFGAHTLEKCHAAASGANPSRSSDDDLDIRCDSFRALLKRKRGHMSGVAVGRDLAIEAGAFCPMHGEISDWGFFQNVARFTEWHTIPTRLAFCQLPATNAIDPCDGVFALGSLINTWLNGRHAPERTSPDELLPALAAHGPVYRKMVRQYFWAAVKRGDVALARLILNLGYPLLPRWRDRLRAAIPTHLMPRLSHPFTNIVKQ